MAHEALIKEGKKALSEDIRPEEIHKYFLKKGMDKKEANNAIKKLEAAQTVEDARRAEKDKRLAKETEQKGSTSASSGKKSSFWAYFIIFLILLAAGYYIYASGIIDLSKILS